MDKQAPSSPLLLSRRLLSGLLAICSLLLTVSVAAQSSQPVRQDPRLIIKSVERFLHVQTANFPGDVSIEVGGVDPRMNLTACSSLQAFLPNGSRAWGKTSVGVRCNENAPWTVYVQATVKVEGDYFVTAAPLSSGGVLDESQLVKRRGDLSSLPSGVITDKAQAIGKSLSMPVAAGTILRQEILRSPQVVQQGQVVRVITHGPGFSVSNEARALANGSEGQLVQARTQHGQVISGIARPGGLLVVTY